MEKTTLKAVLEQIETALRKAIIAKEQGIAYMYICGTKCLNVSVESIEVTKDEKVSPINEAETETASKEAK